CNAMALKNWPFSQFFCKIRLLKSNYLGKVLRRKTLRCPKGASAILVAGSSPAALTKIARFVGLFL
ncbi:MAG: hypothetical protein R3293_28060, partial [Candidatus Promineifilaceae bacterium]|nr:hypothetical protein [Candidatus Promineifilaceae bacterium]